MQVASVSTSDPRVRSEIDGWTFEDAALLVRRSAPSRDDKLFIGYTPSPKNIPHYTCILEMLADGWELLGPPQREDWTTDDGQQHVQWSWWLQRGRPSLTPFTANEISAVLKAINGILNEASVGLTPTDSQRQVLRDLREKLGGLSHKETT